MEARDANEHPAMHRTPQAPTTKDYLAQNVHDVRIEKCWLGIERRPAGA